MKKISNVHLILAAVILVAILYATQGRRQVTQEGFLSDGAVWGIVIGGIVLILIIVFALGGSLWDL